jgi:mRNA interferase HigB
MLGFPLGESIRCRLLPGVSVTSAICPRYSRASILRDGRAVFNIAGNKYRLVVWINYAYRVVYIRFIGTHAQYDRIDAQKI